MKKNLLALLAIFCVSTAVGALGGCFSNPSASGSDSSNGGNDSSISSSASADIETPTFWENWATSNNGKCDYCTSYTIDTGSVRLPDGTECYPTVEVKNSKNEAIVLVGNQFDVEDLDGYTVTWTITHNGQDYVKTLHLSVNVPNPTVLFGALTDYYKGVFASIPTITVLDADGSRISDYTYTLTDPDGNIVETENGRFLPGSVGSYTLEVAATGMSNTEVKNSQVLEVKNIPAGKDITLVHYDTNTDWFSAEGKEFATSIYGMKAIDNTSTEEFKMNIDVGMSLEDLRANFDFIELNIYYWGADGAQAYVRSSAGGENLKTESNEQGTRDQLDFWQDQILTLPVADFDGCLYFQSRWEDLAHFQISMRWAIARVERKIDIEEYAEKVLLGELFTIPTAKYFVHGVEQADSVSVTATFNGEIVQNLGSSVSFDESGELVLTYSIGELKKEITVEYVNEKKIVVEQHAESVMIGTSYTAPAAHVINDITGDTLTGETVAITAKFNDKTIDLTEGYQIKSLGTLEITYSLEGVDPVSISVNVATSELYADSTAMTKISSNAAIKDVDFPGWSQFGEVDGKTAKAIHFNDSEIYTVTFDSEFVADIKADYSNVKLTISLWDNGWHVNAMVNGEMTELRGNAVVTLEFATADWDGTIQLQATHPDWDHEGAHASGYNLCITKVEGSVDSTLTLDEYSNKVLVGATVDLVGATYTIGAYKQDVSLINVSAMFNGETIDMSEGYSATEVGTIEITYTVGDLVQKATIRIVPNQGIVVGDYDKTVLLGSVVTIPTATVVDNVSQDVLEKAITKSATFNDVAITLGETFTSDKSGTLVITYSAEDLADVVITITFSAAITVFDQDVMAKITSDAEIKDVAFPGWAQFGEVDGQTAKAIHFNDTNEHMVTFDSALVADVKAKYTKIAFTISLWDDGWRVNATANGTKKELCGNAVVTFEFSTENWDGTIKLQATHTDWGHPSANGYSLHISKIEGKYVANVLDQDVMTKLTSADAEIKDVTFPGWSQFGKVDGQTAKAIYFNDVNEHTVTFDSALVAEIKAAEYSKISLTISLWDSGWHVSATANGTTKELCGNAVVTFEFSTENWDGTIQLQAFHTDWGHPSENGYSLHFSKIEGLYA